MNVAQAALHVDPYACIWTPDLVLRPVLRSDHLPCIPDLVSTLILIFLSLSRYGLRSYYRTITPSQQTHNPHSLIHIHISLSTTSNVRTARLSLTTYLDSKILIRVSSCIRTASHAHNILLD